MESALEKTINNFKIFINQQFLNYFLHAKFWTRYTTFAVFVHELSKKYPNQIFLAKSSVYRVFNMEMEDFKELLEKCVHIWKKKFPNSMEK